MLADGASVSIYVFFGGTNFGFGAGKSISFPKYEIFLKLHPNFTIL